MGLKTREKGLSLSLVTLEGTRFVMVVTGKLIHLRILSEKTHLIIYKKAIYPIYMYIFITTINCRCVGNVSIIFLTLP